MKKATLSKKILRYSSTAAAVTGVSVANGQILYTDPNPDISISGNFQATRVDVNQDGIEDFEFISVDSLVSGIVPWGKQQLAGLQVGNDVVGYITNGYSYVSLLSMNGTVGQASPFIAGGILAENPQFGASYPLWNNGVTDGYLGFRINLNGSTHHGWMRLDVAADAKSAVLKDMAINLTADDPIACGQSVSIEEDLKERVVIHQNYDALVMRFPGHLLNTEIEILDMTGRVVMRTSANHYEMRLDWSGRPSGIYIVKLRFDDKQVARKLLMR